MFEEKKAVIPFHICNVLIILMVAIGGICGNDGLCFWAYIQLLTTIGHFYIHHLTHLSDWELCF